MRNGYGDKMRNGYGVKCGTDMGIKCGTDMGIKCGTDMWIKCVILMSFFGVWIKDGRGPDADWRTRTGGRGLADAD
jgi:hypothetical protein